MLGSRRAWTLPPAVVAGLAACAPAADDTAAADACAPGDVEVVAGIPGEAGRNDEGLPATATMLYLPQDTARGPDGIWWIVDYNNHLVREVDAAGVARTVVGSGFPWGEHAERAVDEPIDHPTMVLPDPFEPDALWVAVTGLHRIERYWRSSGTLDFPVGTGAEGFGGDGAPARWAWFRRPSSVAMGDDGTLYVSDRMNEVVRAVGADGLVHTVAGTPGVAGYAGDRGPAEEALLNAPAEESSDPANRIAVLGSRLVVADTGNHVVREIDLRTHEIRTLAGTGEPGWRDGAADVAQFDGPHDVAFTDDGTVWVADTNNHCVRAIDPDGAVTTVLGACGEPGDAPLLARAGDVHFSSPVGIDVDEQGRVWVADRNNHVIRRSCVR